MKDGHCRMCGSTEVYTNDAVCFLSSNAPLYLKNELGSVVPQTPFVAYLCTNCGYTALYAKELAVLKELPQAKGWKKAG